MFSYLRVCLGTQGRRHKFSITDTPASKETLEEFDFESGLLFLLSGTSDEAATQLYKGDRPIPTILSLTPVRLWAAVNVLLKLCPVGCTTGFLVFLNEPIFCPSLTSQKNIQLETQSICPFWKKQFSIFTEPTVQACLLSRSSHFLQIIEYFSTNDLKEVKLKNTLLAKRYWMLIMNIWHL